MQAVIMAGGEGTRLRPFTHTIPKPLLPIGRKPIAQLIVERLREQGFRQITMSVNYAADLVRAYFRDGSQFGIPIDYYQEPNRMGTAGSLAHIECIRAECFLVTNGDILTDLDYREFLEQHIASGHLLSVATRHQSVAIPYGVLTLEGDRILGVREKPSMDYAFNAGIYALSPKALEFIPRDKPWDMTDLIHVLLETGETVRSVKLDGLWFDLARVDDFEKALAELEKSHPNLL